MKNEIEFAKMHGAGNDFIMINDIDDKLRLTQGTISALCARHRGIGADGLIVLKPSSISDFRMRYFNKDGGEADMCGNGARCAASFALESSVAGRSMSFETNSGVVRAEVLEEGVRIEIADVRDLKLDLPLEQEFSRTGFAVAGVPHAAAVVSDSGSWTRERFLLVSKNVRNAPLFGEAGTNFNLVTVLDANNIAYRTYERGVEDETLACGTGAVAVSVITTHMGLTRSPVSCRTLGGDLLEVSFEQTGGGATHCSLKGPAVESFRGTAMLDRYAGPVD